MTCSHDPVGFLLFNPSSAPVICNYAISGTVHAEYPIFPVHGKMHIIFVPVMIRLKKKEM